MNVRPALSNISSKGKMKLVSRKKGKKKDWLDLWYQAIMVEKCGCRGGNSAWPCYTFRTQVLLETIVSSRFRAFVCFRHGESECVKTGGRWLKSESALGTSKCASFFGSCRSRGKKGAMAEEAKKSEWEKQTELAQRRLAARPNTRTH